MAGKGPRLPARTGGPWFRLTEAGWAPCGRALLAGGEANVTGAVGLAVLTTLDLRA